MLTNDDINFIKETRKELIENRTTTIKCYFDFGYAVDDFTGEHIPNVELHELTAIVDDRSSRVAAEQRIRESALIEEGDLWISIDIGEIESVMSLPFTCISDLKTIVHFAKRYSVVSWDPKGFGEYYTRVEIVAKEET